MKKYNNLEIIGAVRYDTAIYALPPAPTGKRGRPRKKGNKLNFKDFFYTQIGEYHITEQNVMTNLFEKAIYVTVTTTDTETQLLKRTVGEQISKELLFDSFVSSLESAKIYSTIKEAVYSFLDKDQVA